MTHGAKRCALSALALLVIASVGTTAPAQSPSAEPTCRVRRYIFNATHHADSTRTLCSLTRRPMPRMDTFAGRMRPALNGCDGDLLLVIGPDGVVDSALTKFDFCSARVSFGEAAWPYAETLAALRQIPFTPGAAGDTAVRAGISVKVLIPEGPDTLPAAIRWRYAVGDTSDTMHAEWVRGPAMPVGATREVAAVLLAATAELRVTKLWDGRSAWGGCVALGPALHDVAALEARLRDAHAMLGTNAECAKQDPWRALIFRRVFRLDDRTWTVQFDYPHAADVYVIPSRCRVERIQKGWTAGCG